MLKHHPVLGYFLCAEMRAWVNDDLGNCVEVDTAMYLQQLCHYSALDEGTIYLIPADI